MKETPAAFCTRTGEPYAPAGWMRAVARPLGDDEPCPTLFRYPGPCGLRDVFAGSLHRFGPRASDYLWLSDRLVHADARGARRFGTLAILEPLRRSVVRLEEHDCFLADNTLVASGFVWVPPSAVDGPIDWDDVATVDQALARFGSTYDDERARVATDLGAYLEELDRLRRSGAHGPNVPWCEVPRDERLRTLARLGVPASWSAGA